MTARRHLISFSLPLLAALTACSGEPGPEYPDYPIEQDWESLCGDLCTGRPAQVRVGDGYSCIRYDPEGEGGSVLCWGALRGQPDDPSGQPRMRPPAPLFDYPQIAIPVGISRAYDLAAANGFTDVLVGEDRRQMRWSSSNITRLTPYYNEANHLQSIRGGALGACGVRQDGTGFAVHPWPADRPIRDCAPGQCVTDLEGKLHCFGPNQYGQAGDGDLSELNDVIEVDAEEVYTCALESDGDVWCWGSNAYGTLGYEPSGSYYDENNNYNIYTSDQPQRVEGLPRDIVRIAGSVVTMCALSASGQLYCWGEDYNGIMRLPSPDGLTPGSSTPIAIEDAADIADFDMHVHHGCAIRRSGEVACWGSSAMGAIGPEFPYVPFGHLQTVRGLPEH